MLTAACPLSPGLEPERLVDLGAQWPPVARTVLGPFHNCYNAKVLGVDDRAYPYRMWFFGWAAADHNPQPDGRFLGDAVFHARGRSLSDWEVYAGHSPDGRVLWDREGRPALWQAVFENEDIPSPRDPGVTLVNVANGDPSVVYRNGVYSMAYSAVYFEPHAERDPQALYKIDCVMGAVSHDGITWKRTASPILVWDGEFGTRWDLNAPGRPGQHDSRPAGYHGGYHRPSLLFDRGRWRLWFDYYTPDSFLSMGYAENRGEFADPGQWRVLRNGRQPLLQDWPNPSVVRIDERTLLCFSDAPGYPAEFGGDGRLLTVAESGDGLNWRVLGHLRPEGRACSHVPEPFVERIDTGSILHLFYAWKPEAQPGEPWDFRYKEVRVLSRELP
jgi:hypothetical protein